MSNKTEWIEHTSHLLSDKNSIKFLKSQEKIVDFGCMIEIPARTPQMRAAR